MNAEKLKLVARLARQGEPGERDVAKISIEELQEIMVMARSIKRATLGRLLNEKNTPDSIDRG